jgi:hypothetical protein
VHGRGGNNASSSSVGCSSSASSIGFGSGGGGSDLGGGRDSVGSSGGGASGGLGSVLAAIWLYDSSDAIIHPTAAQPMGHSSGTQVRCRVARRVKNAPLLGKRALINLCPNLATQKARGSQGGETCLL